MEKQVNDQEPKFSIGQNVFLNNETLAVVKKHWTGEGWQYDLMGDGKKMVTLVPEEDLTIT